MIKKIIVQVILLIFIFISTIVLVNRWSNRGIHEVSAEMELPTLPLVYMMVEDQEVNCLHGYITDIEEGLFQESVTPIADNQEVKLRIDEQQGIQEVAYALRSMEGNVLIEEGQVNQLEQSAGSLYVTTTLRMNLEDGQEYIFILYVTLEDGRKLNYYTRLVLGGEIHTKEYLQFIENFHEATFDKERRGDITKYIEPTDHGENENLSHIDIHSNYETVTWGNLSPMRISQMIPQIIEITPEDATVMLSYVAISGSVDNALYYNVDEVYRLKRSEKGELFLMDFHRQVESIFDRNQVNTVKNWFFLGIGDQEKFQYVTSDEDEKVAFVKEGQLWYFDYNRSTLTKVFAFWQDSPLDAKAAYDRHGINIVKLEDNGDMIFTVYGYMNRGHHEGENGVAVYRFQAQSNRLEEIIFLTCRQPYEILKEDASKLTYLNEKNELIYLLGDNVMKINLDTRESTYVVHDIHKEYLGMSKSQRLVAYPNQKQITDCTSINILNLETYEESSIAVGENQRIKIIGFIEEDLVYGVANASDVYLHADGNIQFPMEKVIISDIQGNVVKEYKNENIYCMDAFTQGLSVNLKRARKNGAVYVEEEEDFITLKEADASGIQVNYQYTYDGYNQLYMIFPNYMYVTSIPELVITKEAVQEEIDTIDLTLAEESNRYYVYANGSMQASYAQARMAVLQAYEQGGYVVDRNGKRVWQISGLLEYAGVADVLPRQTCETPGESLQACINMILEYENKDIVVDMDLSGNPNDCIQRYLDATGVNLVGCDVDVALYYLCKGYPIIAKLDEETYVMIISYNETTIRYYHPVTGEEVRDVRYKLEEVFGQQGNQFFTYVR